MILTYQVIFLKTCKNILKLRLKEIGFQTKDFDNYLENYFLSSDGYLFYSGTDFKTSRQVFIDKTISICTVVYFTDDVCWAEQAESVFVDIDLHFAKGRLSSMTWISPTKKEIQRLDIYNKLR